MQKVFSLYLVVCAAQLLQGCGAYPIDRAPKDYELSAENAVPVGFVQDNSRFAFDLYGKIAAAPGNVFFSPHSISTALAMTYAGAAGATREQMRTVLHFPAEDTSLHGDFATLLKQLSEAGQRNGCTLRNANRLWAQKNYPFSQPFLELTRNSYGAEAVTLDYRENPGAAIAAINQWVAEATEGKISKIVAPNTVQPSTRLILTNAIYFKGDWINKFEASSTKSESFSIPGKAEQPVPLMHQMRSFRYTETDSLQAVELPYVGRLSMVIVLPRKSDGLPELEQTLALEGYEKWLAAMYERKVDLFLPRFRMEYNLDLSATLKAMGMPDAFNERADFTAMADLSNPVAKEEPLYLSAVLHKAFVDVNEEGTEAAAVTAVVVGATTQSAPEPPAVFRADHPFLFFIRDMRSGSILFLGRMVQPT